MCVCVYIYIYIVDNYFPSVQNWTFVGLSGNYCLSRGVSVCIISFSYLEVSNELTSIVVDTALRPKILCCIVCLN